MPKQDKVQIINQRRRRPTDSLGVSGAGGAFVPPGTITLTTGNTVGTTHTHELDIESLASLGLGHVLRIVAATGEVVDYGVADDDALDGALGAGAAGDVVLLPACEVSGDHVVPAGVHLVGQSSRGSIIAGRVVLEGGASLEGLTVNVAQASATAIVAVTTGAAAGSAAELVNCLIRCDNSQGDAYGVQAQGIPLSVYGGSLWGSTAPIKE